MEPYVLMHVCMAVKCWLVFWGCSLCCDVKVILNSAARSQKAFTLTCASLIKPKTRLCSSAVTQVNWHVIFLLGVYEWFQLQHKTGVSDTREFRLAQLRVWSIINKAVPFELQLWALKLKTKWCVWNYISGLKAP